MDGSIRGTQQAEKPGRLQLAIMEWQRQLIAKRQAPVEPVIRGGELMGTALAA